VDRRTHAKDRAMTHLSVRNLCVERDGATLIKDITFSATAGEFVGVVGPNGAGKSTLLRAIAGVERAAGSATFNGADVVAMNAVARAKLIAYLPQAREVHWAITAEAVVALGRFAYGAPHRLAAADLAAVERSLAATDSHSFRSRVASTLSGGEQARVHLARALAAETPVLLADEPTAALDLKHALSIIALLRAKADAGGVIIAALHDLDLARRFCTRLVVINQGEIVADGGPETILSPELLAEVFGVSILESHPHRFNLADNR
jgi:iron complex transport system ATP-binding protein